eukprot:g45991.t1
MQTTLETTLKDDRFTDETQQVIQQTIIPTLHSRNKGDNLNTSERKALDKLKKDKNIIILSADKGCMTVIMNKPDYIKEAQALHADTTTYQQVVIDPVQQLGNRIAQTLKRLKDAGQITKTDFMRIKPEGTNTPCFYGLPKVHKPDIPLRPIVSLPGAPSRKLAKDLQQRLKHLVDGSPHSIHSTQDFLDTLKNIKISNDEIMISFDVTALFTSIDIPLGKETVATLLEEAATQTKSSISNDNQLKLLDLYLIAHFIFNGQVYKQINGTPMGSPSSGLLAEAVMQRLEYTTLPNIQPKLWIRTVIIVTITIWDIESSGKTEEGLKEDEILHIKLRSQNKRITREKKNPSGSLREIVRTANAGVRDNSVELEEHSRPGSIR